MSPGAELLVATKGLLVRIRYNQVDAVRCRVLIEWAVQVPQGWQVRETAIHQHHLHSIQCVLTRHSSTAGPR